MYQTLLVYDPMSGKMEPLLAESYRQTEGALEVTVQRNASWSDFLADIPDIHRDWLKRNA
jgi:hypothetical protein